jgi:hypothetical protein
VINTHDTFDSQKLFALLFHRARRRTRAEVQLDFDEPRRARLRTSVGDEAFRSTRALPRLSIHRVDLSPHSD